MRYIKDDLAQRVIKSNEGMDFFKNISEDQEKKLNDAVEKMLMRKNNKKAVDFWKRKAAARIKKKDIKKRLKVLNKDLDGLLEKITDEEKTKLNEIIEKLDNKKKPKKKKSKKKKLGSMRASKASRNRRMARFFNGGRRSRRRSRRRSSRRRFR